MPSIARAASPALPQGASPSSSSSQWHQVSPATRPLNLEVLEVTSLSLTVALTLANPPGASGSGGSGGSLRHQLSSASPLGAGTKHRRKNRTRHSTESEDELTAVEDDGALPAPPYISSAFSGTYPMRIPLSPHARPSFKELLSKGVVVSVNGRPWNRIVAHVTDDEDEYQGTYAQSGAAAGSTAATTGVSGSEVEGGARERRRQQDRAVVVVYGLSPGNEYQVDLKVVGNVDHAAVEVAQASITMTTAAAAPSSSSGPSSGSRSRANSIRKGGRSRSSSLLQPAAQLPSASKAEPEPAAVATADGHLAIPSVERSAPSPDLPEDTQVAELRRLISDAGLEKEDLLAQLKRNRRESQRTEASLRSDIEALKRAMDKTTQPDLRSRQKSLALQEQVKQAWHAASEAEREHDTILNGMGELHKAEATVREAWQKSRTERDHAVEERDDAIEDDRKAMNKLDGELNTLQTKLDKQRTKKAKISKENDELRHKLDEVASAQREVEKRNESIRQQRLLAEDYGAAGGIAGSALGGMMGGGAGYGRAGPWEYDGQWGGARAGARQPVHHASLPGLAASAAEAPATSTSTDLHHVLRGRQLPGASTAYTPSSRPFYPSSASSSAASGPAAMATQGIPLRSGNNTLSHVGNPIGFYPSQGPSTSTNRSFRVVSRDGASPSPATTSAGPISPLMANVTAAPFMPANRLHTTTTSPEPLQGGGYLSPTYDHQTTSLVPPQLQHRIYLPQSRNKLSPSLISPGDETNEARNSEEGPAFPPLPSQTATQNANKALPSGPSLASIVTRAIIPSSQAASAPNSASQRSPSGSLRGPASAHEPAPRSGGALSPGSPWGAAANIGVGVPARQTAGTPPAGGWPAARSGGSSGSGSGGPSRRSSLQPVGGQDAAEK